MISLLLSLEVNSWLQVQTKIQTAKLLYKIVIFLPVKIA